MPAWLSVIAVRSGTGGTLIFSYIRKLVFFFFFFFFFFFGGGGVLLCGGGGGRSSQNMLKFQIFLGFA